MDESIMLASKLHIYNKLINHKITNSHELLSQNDFTVLIANVIEFAEYGFIGIHVNEDNHGAISGVYIPDMGFSLKESLNLIYHSTLIFELKSDYTNDYLSVKKISSESARNYIVENVSAPITTKCSLAAACLLLKSRIWPNEPALEKSISNLKHWQLHFEADHNFKVSNFIRQCLND